jgi:hypothetical protein
MYVFIARWDDPLLQASFGLAMSFFFFIFQSLNEAIFEVTGLSLSLAKGKGRFDYMTTCLAMGFTLQILIFIFCFFMFYFSQSLLVGIGIAPANAEVKFFKLKKRLQAKSYGL